VLNPILSRGEKFGKGSQRMAYSPLITISGAFAKKNARQIGFENIREIYRVWQLLSFYRRIMKKIIVLSVLSFVMLWLMGCTTKKTDTNAAACKQAIQTYLDQSQKSTTGMEVAKGDAVTVDYIGRLDDSTVFDTSVESIAKACGKYTAGRDYTGGLLFNVWVGHMIAGFDQGVVGMKVGETKTIQIEPKDAYGEYNQELVFTIEKDKIPEADKYEVGMQVIGNNGQPFTVKEITSTSIIFDANHELAGKTLIFDITIKNVEKPTQQ
jgi:FKBP-type peptidyl-prolyl cis-trans isomerase 2